MSIAPALVPQELRPRRTQLWSLADRTTWGFGSRVARAGAPQAGRPENPWLRWPSALWRIPATIVSWLAFLPHPETLAAQGKAHLKVAPLTERTEPAPWWQRRAVAGLVFGVDLVGGAAGVVAVLSMTRNPVILAVLGITVLGVVAGIVETLNAGWRAAGRGAQRYDGLAQLRALGHTGPVGYAACYVSRRKGDIDANRDDVVAGRRLGVEPICSLLQVAPSSYYEVKARQQRAPSARAQRDAVMVPVVRQLWEDNYRV